MHVKWKYKAKMFSLCSYSLHCSSRRALRSHPTAPPQWGRGACHSAPPAGSVFARDGPPVVPVAGRGPGGRGTGRGGAPDGDRMLSRVVSSDCKQSRDVCIYIYMYKVY